MWSNPVIDEKISCDHSFYVDLIIFLILHKKNNLNVWEIRNPPSLIPQSHKLTIYIYDFTPLAFRGQIKVFHPFFIHFILNSCQRGCALWQVWQNHFRDLEENAVAFNGSVGKQLFQEISGKKKKRAAFFPRISYECIPPKRVLQRLMV